MVEAGRMFDAVSTAFQSLRSATDVSVPFFGRRAAIDTVHGHLDDAANALRDASDAAAAADATVAASLLGDAASRAAGARGAFQARAGVGELHTAITDVRSRTLDALVDAHRAGVEIDPTFAATHLRRSLARSKIASFRDAIGTTTAEVLARRPDELAPKEWRALAITGAMPDAIRPDDVLTPGAWKTLTDELARGDAAFGSGYRPPAEWAGWRMLNQRHAERSYATRAQADDRLDQIVGLDDASLTRRDLHDLDGLLQLDAARRPQALAGATLSDAAEVAEQLGDAGQVPASWSGLRVLNDIRPGRGWRDTASATRALHEVLGTSVDDMTAGDLDVIARLAELPEGVRPAGLTTNIPRQTTAETLRAVAGLLRTGAPVNPHWGGWGMLNRLRAEATFSTREAAEARLLEITMTPHDQLTRAALHELDGIRQLPDHLRPAALDPRLETATLAETRGSGEALDPRWRGWDLLDGIAASATWSDRAAATAAMREAIGATADDMTGDGLRQLARLAALPDDLRPTGLSTNIPRQTTPQTMRQVAALLDSGEGVNPQWGGWTTLNRLRAEATYTSRDAVDARLLALASKPRDELTRADLHDLDGLRQLSDDLRPPILDGKLDAFIAAERRGAGEAIDTAWPGWELLDGIEAAARWTTRDDATAALRGALRSSAADVTSEDMRTLSRLASLPDELRPAGLQIPLRDRTTAQTLRNVANAMDTGAEVHADWLGWPVLNKLRAEANYATRADAEARLQVIAATPRDQLTRADLHDLDGLRQLPDGLRPAALDGKISSFAAAEYRGTGVEINSSWAGWELLDGIESAARWTTSDDATAALRGALRSSAADVTSEDMRTLSRLATLPDELRPAGLQITLRDRTTAQTLRNVAAAMESGTDVNAAWAGWPVLNRLRAGVTFTTREAAEDRLRVIAATPRDQLTRADLHDLDGLRQLPDGLRPAALDGTIAASAAAELRGAGLAIDAAWPGWELLDGIDAAASWTSPDAAKIALRDALRTHAGETTSEDMRTLARLATLPDELRPAGLEIPLRDRTTSQTLRNVAAAMDEGVGINSEWAGWTVLNKLRAEATYTTRDAAEVRLRELATIPREQLTRADLHELDGIRQLGDELRPKLIDPSISMAKAAELRGAGTEIAASWVGWNLFDAVTLEALLPADAAGRATRIRTLLDERVASGTTPELLGAVLRLRSDLVPADVADLAKIIHANDLLREIPRTGVARSTGPRAALEAARDALDGLQPEHPGLAALATETRMLIDRNLDRINGIKGPVAGYSNYTDLAEVGRVGSNVELLERTWKAQSSVPAAPSTNAETAPASGAETLTW